MAIVKPSQLYQRHIYQPYPRLAAACVYHNFFRESPEDYFHVGAIENLRFTQDYFYLLFTNVTTFAITQPKRARHLSF